MSGMINVNGSDDPSYRYKMPRLIGKIEGRGNGIKTVIVNCSDIAQSLNRPSGQVTKFFGCELGAMTKYENKIDRSLVNGAFETNDLQNILSKYIEKFVLCASCGNPETIMEVKGKKKSASIWLSCKACGAIEEADNSHKLCTYILKEMTGPSKGSSKEERKKKKAERKAAAEAGDHSGEKEKKKKKKKDRDRKGSDDSEERRRRRKEKKREKELRLKAQSAESKTNPEDSDSSANSDGAPVATLENMTIDDVAAIDTAVSRLQAMMSGSKMSNDKLVEEAITLQTNSGLDMNDRICILFFAVVCDQSMTAFMANMASLKKLVTCNDDQVEVLGCLEESVLRVELANRPTALQVAPLVLKQLYDDEIVEEDVILQWHSGTVKPKHRRCVVSDEVVQQLKTSVQPIIDWLNEADSEGESEEE